MPQERKNVGEWDTRQEQVDERRRRLATAAGAAVPMFFVLRHGRARAQTVSGSPGSPQMGSTSFGRPPSFWKNRPDQWPSGFDPGSPKVENLARQGLPNTGGTRFFDVFQWGDHFRAAESKRLALMDVLRLHEEEDPYGMGAYFVAALLNASSGMTEPLPVGRVQDMWQQWSTRGFYSPQSGVDSWYADDIKRYIETTWA